MAIHRRKLKGGGCVYVVAVRDRDGAWFPRKTFETKRDAQEHEALLKAQKIQGVKVKSRDIREQTLSEYWLKWADECRTDVSDGWKMTQEQMWRDHIEPILGTHKLLEVEAEHIASFMAKMAKKVNKKTKQALGAQSRIHLYNLLHRMFEDTVETYAVRTSNPVLERFKPEKPTVKRKFLRPTIARAFLDDVSGHRLGAALWVMIFCGFRSGEMQALRRKNIDLDDCSITITEQWVRKEKRLGPLKNREPLTVPMPVELVKYLRRKLPADMAPEAFIAQSRKGGMISHFVLYWELKQLCKKHGMPALSPHELRHTCAEIWVDMGATREDLRRIFNHSSDASIEPYLHKVDDRLRRLADQRLAHLRVVK